jgi:drug/metabolite transporter (DMT)-like permease
MLFDHFLLLLLCILYGLFFTIGKIALQFSAPLFFTGIRMIIAGVILLTYYCFTYKSSLILTKKQWLYIFAVGLFGIYITNASEFWGLQYVSAGKSSLICCFYPIITAIISWILFSEKMTRKKIIGLLIGTLGFIPVFMGEKPIEDISGFIGGISYAEIALLGSAIATAIGWLIAREAIKFTHINIIVLNAISMLLGGIISLIHSYYSEPWHPFPIYDRGNFLLSLIIIIISSNILSYNLHGYLLKKFTATYISFANLIDPIFASFFGWVFLGEVLNCNFWLSMICVGIGLSLYYRENLRLKE